MIRMLEGGVAGGVSDECGAKVRGERRQRRERERREIERERELEH